ncbi:type II toxin-antitoxin system YoeB family toxin [Blautia sp. MSJ-9]|uniref:type II toxin-antitoxin system YoeB family toxin n=1 Tax=Blautia sp. TaxID=1955243 RepID=UPI001C118089|nr:type II toxin-antitoxin system YoeB family toxin [Blautia sp.]MBU5680483.1 type II toxin-antitoxin system YoeB family toxin [Blautia sp. MSJ-9]MDY4114366.1 type II toxin-antitoxin system YoeB family toxin [Blautia sp.]
MYSGENSIVFDNKCQNDYNEKEICSSKISGNLLYESWRQWQKWSRRINLKDRLVYEITDETIIVIQCKGHYSDK